MNTNTRQKRTWLSRIGYHSELAHELLNNGWLSIGYGDFVEEFGERIVSKMDATETKDICTEARYCTWGEGSHAIHDLTRFVLMREGDWVVVP